MSPCDEIPIELSMSWHGSAQRKVYTTEDMLKKSLWEVWGLASLDVLFDIEPLSNNPDESYSRYPDLNTEPDSDGNLFFQHASLSESSGTLFSPGTRIDGTNFN